MTITAETIRQDLRCGQPGCKCGKSKTDVHCPAHTSDKANLSVSEKNGKILVKCHAGCSQDQVISALKAKSLWPSKNVDQPKKFNIVKAYDYTDAAGKSLYQSCRLDHKEFKQRRPDPAHPGKWIWKMDGVKLVIYRLPEVIKADAVFIVEGEKDADNLAAIGVIATTNVGGAGKWQDSYDEYFQGKAVVILPDNDNPGRDHALKVARHLHGVAASVKIIELPGLPEKGDVSDWLESGKDLPVDSARKALMAMVTTAPEFNPTTAPPDSKAQDQVKDDSEAKPTQAELLLKLAAEAELFHDLNRKGYATIPVKGHLETWPIKSMAFRDWLRGLFYKAHKKPPGSQALQDSLDLLAAQARFDGQETVVHVRVAHAGGQIFVDLANDEWQAVDITISGWQIVDRPPVKFRRPRGLAPLPCPESGGTIDDLKPFVNCREEDWPLIVAWLIGAFSPGPYPGLIFQAEQGCAKTTTARVLKSLVDPGHSPQRTAPRDIRDLMISAANSWCLSFDNLSDLKDWLSDGFCRLATGGGLSTRELYSDDNEVILDAIRPVLLNGIDSLVSRADLAARSILLELPRIQSEYRRREVDLWRDFEKAQPGIIGAVFNALSVALANVHKVKLGQLPRMADFATWIVAAEPALPWQAGTFLDAYARNIASVVEHSLEGDPVAVAVRSYMEHREIWEGTPTELLNELTDVVGELVSRSKNWPKAANGLSNRLRRASTFLRASGIEVDGIKGSGGKRYIEIRKGLQKTATTATIAQSEKPCGFSCGDPSGDSGDSGDPTIKTATRPPQRKASNDAGLGDSGDSGDKIQDFSKEHAEVEELTW